MRIGEGIRNQGRIGRARIIILFSLVILVGKDSATPSRISAAPLSIGVGGCTVVTGTGTGLNVRDGPGTNYNLVGSLPDGTVIKIIGGPANGSGYTWWQHDHGGWSASNWLADTSCPSGGTSPVQVLNSSNNYFLKVDLQDSRVRFRVGLANNDSGGYETLNSMKNRYAGHGYLEWAIINGDYFALSGCPSNVNCAEGLTYIDGTRKDNWSQYGTTWPVRGNLGFDSSNGVQGAIGDGQTKRNMVIAGGPWIVKDGGSPVCSGTLVSVNGATKTQFTTGEMFDGDVRGWCTDTRGITMVGYSSDHRYVYMGVSTGGNTVLQVAQWLKNQGAFEVLKLDNGGSSGMYYNGTQILATDGRGLADHLALIVDNVPPGPGDGIGLYSGTSYGGDSQIYTYSSDSTCINLANTGMDNRSQSLRFLGSYVGNYDAKMYGDNSCGVYNARYGQDTSDFGALNNQFSSMQIEKHQPPPTCYTLSTNVNPGGSGTVSPSSSPNCNNGTQYTSGTNVSLTASAASGYSFSNWSGCDSTSGNTCNVTMNSSKSVTANFTANPACYTLTTSVNPSGSGSVNANPGPNCGSQYTAGTNVQLTANPASGYSFNSWNGCDSTSGNTCNVTMNSGKNVTANFSTSTASISVISVFVTDGNDNDKTSFNPGDSIRYYGHITNSSTVSQTAHFVWSLNGPCGPIPLWSGDLATDAGTVEWRFPGTIPASACGGTYTYQLSVTYNGATSSRSTVFTVNGTMFRLFMPFIRR